MGKSKNSEKSENAHRTMMSYRWAGAEVSLDRLTKKIISLKEYEHGEKSKFIISSSENRNKVMDYIFGKIDENPFAEINNDIEKRKQNIDNLIEILHERMLSKN